MCWYNSKCLARFWLAVNQTASFIQKAKFKVKLNLITSRFLVLSCSVSKVFSVLKLGTNIRLCSYFSFDWPLFFAWYKQSAHLEESSYFVLKGFFFYEAYLVMN